MARRHAPVALLLGLAMVAWPLAIAGSFEDPEITDATGDASISGQGDAAEQHFDINRSWVSFGGGTLDLQIHVENGGNFDTLASTLNGSWNVVFDANGSTWRAEMSWAGLPPGQSSQIYQDGEAIQTANSSSIDGQNITISWDDAGDTLPSTATLTNLYAYTSADTGADVDCNGNDAVDCAPDDGFGDDFPLGGAVADLALEVGSETRTGGPGSSVGFVLSVTNNGSQAKNVTFDTDLPDSWNPSFTPANATVAPNGTNQTALEATVPSDQEPGNVTFNATASAGGDSLSQTLTVQVTNQTGPRFDVSVSISDASKSGAPGSEVTYTMQVSNVGSEDDSYNIHADEGDSDLISYSENIISVAAGETKEVTATVSIPSDAAEGDEIEHVVGIHSENNPEKDDTVTLTTTVDSGSGGDGDSGVLSDILGGSGQTTQFLLIGGLIILIVIVILLAVIIKNRRERKLVGADEDEDDEEGTYEP